LSLDGVAGPETRRQLVAEYMAIDATSLPAGVEPVVHGCGENFPEDSLSDSPTDANDRRVEVFLFDAGLGVQPPPPGPNSGPGSPEFPEWVRRSQRTDDHILPATGQLIPTLHSQTSGGGGLDTTRTKLGVGEEVTLSNPSGNANWSVTGA